jgi:hypothetical protein
MSATGTQGLAIGDAFSNDIFKMARLALQAALRSEDDVAELLAGRRVCARKRGGAGRRITDLDALHA